MTTLVGAGGGGGETVPDPDEPQPAALKIQEVNRTESTVDRAVTPEW
jgi:hypothetical protein